MGDKTGIEWTDASWNPIRGCSRVSEGCRHCYAERVASRFSGPGQAYEGLAVIKNDGPHWTGEVQFVEAHLVDPLCWQRPRRIFVNSMSDLFHEKVHDVWIEEIWDVMLKAKQHIFQILTKRPERMREWVSNWKFTTGKQSVLPNVWLGISAEDQKTTEERIPLLLHTPAAVRWISAEPLLGPMSLSHFFWRGGEKRANGIDWVVVGGESGPGARPMHPDWARLLRNQCRAAGVPFFFKQWGEWGSRGGHPPGTPGKFWILGNDGLPISTQTDNYPRSFESFGSCVLEKLGKAKSGRLLDGREWNEYPDVD